MSTSGLSKCPHVRSVGNWAWEDIRSKLKASCQTCSAYAPNLWLCLVGQCHYIGCGETRQDHSTIHSQVKKHCLTINLTTLRLWCYICETEVFPGKNDPVFVIRDQRIPSGVASSPQKRIGNSGDSSPGRTMAGVAEDSDSDYEDGVIKPRGLTGLQNLGNTCYMNAALQALSNCPPLTQYFLDCYGVVQPERSPMLSKSYQKLVMELWHKKRPSYIVPSAVSSGIKIVHPMFKGFTQQDTQEFLRCFMDQIHEELKCPIQIEDRDEYSGGEETDFQEKPLFNPSIHARQPSMDSSSSSQSEADYETCDSGLSSDRSSVEPCGSSDDGSDGTEQMHIRRRFPSHMHSRNSSASLPNLNDEKEKANLLKNCVPAGSSLQSGDEASRSDGTDYSDALSDQESCHGKKKVIRGQRSNMRHKSETDAFPPGRRGLKLSPKMSPRGQHNLGTGLYCSASRKSSQCYRSVITDIFDGKILSSVQCLTCERVSTRKETFQDLSLPIPTKDSLHMLHSNQAVSGNLRAVASCGEGKQGWISWVMGWMKSWFIGPTITLQDCLATFFSADELKGDNMYSCDKCKKLRNGIKFSKVLELPEILCVHLKRFRHEFMFSSKISSHVFFPLDGLDMKPYLHKDCSSEITMYDLNAVICHHGTAGGGHYTAYCLNHLNDQWYEFDDQYVTEVDFGQIINAEAYVLFYRKRNDEMVNLREKAMELMDTREPSLLRFYISRQWINKFNTFAEPGPITNSDFLCHHGGVPPSRLACADQLVEEIDQSVWQFLHERFGGGPACNHLYACSNCQRELDKLRHRQKTEIDTFIELNDQFHKDEVVMDILAISMTWFKSWESFVRGKTDTPPGPINNSRIAMMKGGQHVVKPSSDQGQLSQPMWEFFHGIYGGGPKVVINQQQNSPICTNSPPASSNGSVGSGAGVVSNVGVISGAGVISSAGGDAGTAACPGQAHVVSEVTSTAGISQHAVCTDSNSSSSRSNIVETMQYEQHRISADMSPDSQQTNDNSNNIHARVVVSGPSSSSDYPAGDTSSKIINTQTKLSPPKPSPVKELLSENIGMSRSHENVHAHVDWLPNYVPVVDGNEVLSGPNHSSGSPSVSPSKLPHSKPRSPSTSEPKIKHLKSDMS